LRVLTRLARIITYWKAGNGFDRPNRQAARFWRTGAPDGTTLGKAPFSDRGANRIEFKPVPGARTLA